jgi:RND family efflux transporter MFP subunit
MPRYLKTGLKLLAVAVVGLMIVFVLFIKPQKVESLQAGAGSITAEAVGTGTLEARVRTMISPQISGRLAQVLVDQGDTVVKGQTLCLLDDEDLRQQVEMAKAELSFARAGVEKADSGIKRAEAIEKEARTSFARYAELSPTGAVSVDAYEKVRQQMEVAAAELTQAHSAKLEAEKLVVKDQASLQYAQAQLAYTVIAAPFDGLVVKRYRDAGGIVVPGNMVLELISLDQLWISAWVDETLLNTLKVGQTANVVFRSDPGTALPGKVVRISPQADRETREVLVDVAVDPLPRTWAVGQRAEVYIETARKENVTVIPQRVIVWRNGQPGVFIIDNGKARWRRIVLGIEGQETVEVVEGLHAGQAVLIPGSNMPKDGRRVKVTAQ